MPNDRTKPAAFTLVEVLVVIALVVILAAVLFPLLARAKETAKQAASANNLRQIGVAVLLYASDADDVFPLSTSYHGAVDWLSVPPPPAVVECSLTKTSNLLDVPLAPYLKEQRVFVSPFTGEQPSGKLGVRRIAYMPNCRLLFRDYRLSSLPLPGDTTLPHEEDHAGNPRTLGSDSARNCLFDDTHVKLVSRSLCFAKTEPEPLPGR